MSVFSLLSLASLAIAVWFFLPKLLLHTTIAFAAFISLSLVAVAQGGADQLQYIVLGGAVVALAVSMSRLVFTR